MFYIAVIRLPLPNLTLSIMGTS